MTLDASCTKEPGWSVSTANSPGGGGSYDSHNLFKVTTYIKRTTALGYEPAPVVQVFSAFHVLILRHAVGVTQLVVPHRMNCSVELPASAERVRQYGERVVEHHSLHAARGAWPHRRVDNACIRAMVMLCASRLFSHAGHSFTTRMPYAMRLNGEW